MKVIKPPQRAELEELSVLYKGNNTVFLAGSIEMGAAEHWQRRIEEALKDEDIVVFNPRRDDWDSSWEQKASNPVFKEQVTWELDHLVGSDHVLMYFQPGTLSPITLLEFGFRLAHNFEGLIVVCPDGFWKKGNIEVMCKGLEIPLYNSLEEGIAELKKQINEQ